MKADDGTCDAAMSRSVRERLAAALASLGEEREPSPEEERRILHERAAALARESAVDTEAGECVETVDFALAGETFGIEAQYVQEIHVLRDLTRLPCTPAFVAGIINIRGKILSVIDIGTFFELPSSGRTEHGRVIIIGNDGMEFGIRADAILDIHRTPVREVQPSLPTLTGIRQDFLKGVTNRRVAILDARKLLADERILVNEKV